MKKFSKAIKKNFKILFRIKASLIAMILGPLLVIFLIGFAFNSSAQFQINIGYTLQDNSTLSYDFVKSLNDEYNLQSFDTIDDCVWELKQSLQHVCIDFPKDFVILEGQSNNITFYVDKTRINIVYAVLSSVSKQIGLKTDQLSEGLTQKLIDTLDESSTKIDSNLGNLILIKKAITKAQTNINGVKSDLSTLDFEHETIDADQGDLIAKVKTNSNNIKKSAQAAASSGLTLISTIRAGVTNTTKLAQLDTLETELIDLNNSVQEEYNKTDLSIEKLLVAVNKVIDEIDDLEVQFSAAKQEVGTSITDLNTVTSDLNKLIVDVDTVKQNLEKASQNINGLEITSSEQIVNPITTNIKTVSSDKNQLLVLFPYVLLLIVMFGGLMLASTLVVLEKKSRAFFRVFTTPTKNQFYIWTTFFTGFIILMLQMFIIYVLMKFFFIDLIGSQLLTNVAVLVISSSLFIMMGMGVGYVMKNQQGANMISVSLGSIFLFLSNIVLPLETVAPYLQELAQYNPFVIASEILRKSIIFQTPIQELYHPLALLIGYVVIIFVLITFFHNFAKIVFVQRLTKKTKRSIRKKGVKVQDQIISNEKELITFVNKTSDKEFKVIIKHNRRFRRFIRDEISDGIGRRSHKLTKKEFLSAIEQKNRDIIAYLEQKKPLHKLNKKKNTSK